MSSFPLKLLLVELNFLFAALSSSVPLQRFLYIQKRHWFGDAVALCLTVWCGGLLCEAFWAYCFQTCQRLQILRLDFEYSVIQSPRLVMHVHNVFSESWYYVPLLFFPVIPFSWCAWQISRSSLLKESYWRILFPNDLEMFLLLIFSS